MFEVIFKIWWMIALMPLFIFQEGNKWMVKFLRQRGIYWDVWYSLLVCLIIILLVLLIGGYGF
jgi:hypothetical protein